MRLVFISNCFGVQFLSKRGMKHKNQTELRIDIQSEYLHKMVEVFLYILVVKVEPCYYGCQHWCESIVSPYAGNQGSKTKKNCVLSFDDLDSSSSVIFLVPSLFFFASWFHLLPIPQIS